MDPACVPRETEEALLQYVDLLRIGNATQNLVSATTLNQAWQRHILDSAQLSPLVRGDVIDVGSGAGLPGVVLALLGHRVTLLEPRRRRAKFLEATLDTLGLTNTRVIRRPAAAFHERFTTITARAVAPLEQLLALTHHLADPETRWVLPKGKSVNTELALARATWHGRFELVPSITDPAGMIVIAEEIRPRSHR